MNILGHSCNGEHIHNDHFHGGSGGGGYMHYGRFQYYQFNSIQFNSIQFFIFYVLSKQLQVTDTAQCSNKRVLEENHNNQQTNDIRGKKVLY
jgi:hypothetical protein